MDPAYCQRKIHQEIHMYTKTAFISACPLLGAALVSCALIANVAAAQDQEFPVDYHVSKSGLDLNQPAGANELYARLQHAAQVVCTHGMRVDLVPVSDQKACYEKALGDAVRTVNAKLLTKVYLATRTSEEAIARGIDVTVHVAAK
jgi:UrcA family protein